MRDPTLKTFCGSSSTRGPTRQPQTCVFLPKARASGRIPKCSWAHILPVSPIPVCTSSTMKKHWFCRAMRSRACRNSGRKWLSPPSAWIGSMMMAAMSSGLSAKAWRVWSRARSSAAFTSVSTSEVTGKRSLGLSIRGQRNFGKKSVLMGSVLVSDSV